MEDPSIREEKIDEVIKDCKMLFDMSYYKYGEARKNFAEGRVDALKSLDNAIIAFNRTKNLEYLEDVINYALLRILFPFPGDYYKHTDSDGSAGLEGVPINME